MEKGYLLAFIEQCITIFYHQYHRYITFKFRDFDLLHILFRYKHLEMATPCATWHAL